MASKGELKSFYSKTNILLTGGCGFFGKMLIQKLLRTYDDLECIYLIIRNKKGKSPNERIKEVFKNSVFDLLRQDKPNFTEKIRVLEGDINLPKFGLNSIDMQLIKEKVDVVFHCAANLKIDMPLKNAIEMNVKSIYELLGLCHEMKKLKSLLFVSTAMSNCHNSVIEEKIYKPLHSPEVILTLVNDKEESILEQITPGLLSGHPNTYTFSKHLCEEVLHTKSEKLPVVIFRPSIVINTYTDPIPGWSDNLYGPNIITIYYAMGIGRVISVQPNFKGDIVPVDYCINALICSAWHATKQRLIFPKEIPVYNYAAGPKYSIKWVEFIDKFSKNLNVHFNGIMWKPFYFLSSNKYIFYFLHVLLHLVPAYIIDFLLYFRSKPKMIKIYRQYFKRIRPLGAFMFKEWEIKNGNVYDMWDSLSDEEKSLHPFHMKLVDYEKYFRTYTIGLKVHVLGESLDDVHVANGRYRRFVILHNTLLTVLCVIALWLLLSLYI